MSSRLSREGRGWSEGKGGPRFDDLDELVHTITKLIPEAEEASVYRVDE